MQEQRARLVYRGLEPRVHKALEEVGVDVDEVQRIRRLGPVRLHLDLADREWLAAQGVATLGRHGDEAVSPRPLIDLVLVAGFGLVRAKPAVDEHLFDDQAAHGRRHQGCEVVPHGRLVGHAVELAIVEQPRGSPRAEAADHVHQRALLDVNAGDHADDAGRNLAPGIWQAVAENGLPLGQIAGCSGAVKLPEPGVHHGLDLVVLPGKEGVQVALRALAERHERAAEPACPA